MELRKALPVRVAVVMMIDGIVPDGYSGAVQSFVLVERSRGVIDCEEHLALNPACLPVVRDERQAVRSRELVVGDSDVPVTELCLDVIDEASGDILGFLVCGKTFLRSHLHDIRIVVVAVYRPVEHIFLSAGQTAVVQHFLRRPQNPSMGRSGAPGPLAAVQEHIGRISLRALNGHVRIGTVILQNRHIGHVLHDVIGLFRSNLLAGFRTRVHSDMILHPARGRDVTEFRSVNHDLGTDRKPRTVSPAERSGPSAVGLFSHLKGISMSQPETALPCRHPMQDFVSDMRLKQDVAHPAALQGIVAAVMGSQTVAELSEDASAKPVVPIHRADSGRRQHSAEPRGFLHNQCRCPGTRGLYSCGDTARSSAHDKHIRRLESLRGHVSEPVGDADFAGLRLRRHQRTEHILCQDSAHPATLERRRVPVEFTGKRILALETLHVADLHPVLEILHLPLGVIVPDIRDNLSRIEGRVHIDLHPVILRRSAAIVSPFHVRAVKCVEFEAGGTAIDAYRAAPPGAAERADIVLHKAVADDFVVSRVDVSGKNQRVVGCKQVIDSLLVAHHVRNLAEVEVVASPVPLAQGRRDVERDHHLLVLAHEGEVLFHPAQLLLREIADVVPVLADIEVVVQHDVVHFPDIERVVSRPVHRLEVPGRALERASVVGHVVVADDLPEIHAGRVHNLVVLRIELVVPAHNVAKTKPEGVVPGDLFRTLADIFSIFPQPGELFGIAYLRVRNHNQVVPRVVLRVAFQREVIDLFLRLNPLPPAPRPARRAYVPARRRNEDETAFRSNLNAEPALRVRHDDAVPVRHGHPGHALSLASHRSRHRPSISGQRHKNRQNCQYYLFHIPIFKKIYSNRSESYKIL